MKALYPGHLYELSRLDGEGVERLQFVSRAPLHPPMAGTTCQEVLRALIDRVSVLDGEVRWSGNDDLLHHLRMALAHFEARALLRHVEKGHLKPEELPIGGDGHFLIVGGNHEL